MGSDSAALVVPSSPVYDDDDDDADDDDLTFGSNSMHEELTAAIYGVKSPGQDDGAWQFDLGPLGNEVDKVSGERAPRRTMETVTKLSEDTDTDDDDDVSHMEEAKLAMEAITRRASQQATQGFDNRSTHSAPSTTSSKGSDRDNYTEVLEQRRAARKLRLEKIRERIEREKEESRIKKENDDRQAKERYRSEEGRRERAYKFYCRVGMVSSKEMKKRVKALGKGAPIKEEDVDLLPWNFSGTVVNIAKLNKTIFKAQG